MNPGLRTLLSSFALVASAAVIGQQTDDDREFSGFNPIIEAQSVTPYVGVTTDGTPIEGLYSIDPSAGASNAELVQVAKDFLAALTREQREKAMYAVDSREWREWSNTSNYRRNGIGFDEMTEGQREQAFDLMRAALSAKGFAQSRDIMRLNHTLGELTGRPDRYSEWFYWFTFMGEPSDSEPWGFQVDGHHLVINYFVLGNQVVMSPVFTGSEPAIATSGRYNGTRVMDAEREKAYAVYASLTDEQKAMAELSPEDLIEDGGGAFGRNSTELAEDNAVIPYAGIPVRNLSDNQRELLIELIEEFVTFNRDVHARVRMDEVMAHIDDTVFGWDQWDASQGLDDVFFFRIQSPVIIIEFDHQGAIALPNSRKDIPIREHIHAVVRTPNGNDYGKDLLRQHYQRHPH